MGGYGAYVWTAYGFTVAALGGLFWQSRRFARKRSAELERLRGTLPSRGPRAQRRLVAQRLTDPAVEASSAAGPADEPHLS
jgi:heme exporter protein CcmD